jgi:cellulose synthase/poly-beta-1,6-N-acetylglucosamine synthase-like glycosyltransferase
MTRPFACAVAIPARNERDLLPRCLTALAQQTVAPAKFATVVLANNCHDDTADQARAFSQLPNLYVEEVTFAEGSNHAGSARRAAMACAATYSDIVLTTDADCVPDSDWIEAMLAAFAAPVDAVAGAVSGDWEELQHQPAEALAIGALEWEYLMLLAKAEAIFDPQPHDSMPRHAQCCGANMGITRAMLASVGGVPAIPTGEDRALMEAIERHGGKVRHDPRPHVTASARAVGRASGGMADALTARMSPDYRCDEQFEPADALIARLKLRHATRSNGPAGSATAMPHRRLTVAQLASELPLLRRLIDVAEAR